MSKRRHDGSAKGGQGKAAAGSGAGAAKFDRAAYPALQEMLPAYLHQDFGDEYGSASAAAKAFLGDASNEEIAGVRDEWKKLDGALAGRGIGAWQAALHELGSGWYPASEAEVSAVGEILTRGAA